MYGRNYSANDFIYRSTEISLRPRNNDVHHISEEFRNSLGAC